MGRLVDGQWRDDWYQFKQDGKFRRQDSAFRNFIKKGDPDFPAESGRYHLYISLACPWAHRTLILRKLKGLEDVISLSVVDHLMLEQGWVFTDNADCIPDSVNGFTYAHQLYTKADPGYSGRVTVPILWDKKTDTIVNNESREIIRMFDLEFDEWATRSGCFYPQHLAAEIDAMIDANYNPVNNGVYRCGFAQLQSAYDEAVDELFGRLEELEQHLAQQRYLVSDQLTHADICLFTTLIRFDAVYVGHFKCNIKRIFDFPNLSHYVRDIFQTAGIGETVNFRHIKQHYYQSHLSLNPKGVVPRGPTQDFSQDHNRDRLGPRKLS